MSTAVAVSPAQAIKDAQAGVNAMIPRRENLMGTRYAWYGLDSIHHQDLDAMTNGANGGFMPRCKWQPITKAQRWVHVGALGDNGAAEVVARRNPDPGNGKPREEMFWIKPWAIINSLGMLYGERGLIDSATLRYSELEAFEALQLDDFFFPEPEEKLPQTFKLSEARIIEQLRRLEAGEYVTPDGRQLSITRERAGVMLLCGQEMLGSLRRSAVYARKVIDERHAEMEKAAAGVAGNRGTYDDRERRLLAWLEITPRNAALEKIALDSNALPGVIQQMANVVAQQATRQPETLDVGALGAAIGASLAKELAPLMAKPESAKADEANSANSAPKPKK